MKLRSGPPTDTELAMAEGQKPVDEADTNKHLSTLDENRETLERAWQRQREAQQVSCYVVHTPC